MPGAKNWLFTLNHYTDEEEQSFRDLSSLPTVKYLIFGREVAPTTLTPHLQGYIRFDSRRTLQFIRTEVNARAHWEVARGSPQQNREYCSKEGNFEEFGDVPSSPRPTSLVQAQQWIRERVDAGEHPSDRELAAEHPVAFIHHRRNLLAYIDAIVPTPRIRPDVELRGWQPDLLERLSSDADDRKIEFFVNPEGGAGKTFFIQHYMSVKDDAQCLSVGKRDDMAHAIDPTKRVFFINVPRGSMEFFQYSIVESLKDRMVFSPKYDSKNKILRHWPHVIVMTNEYPDVSKLTPDRINIHNI